MAALDRGDVQWCPTDDDYFLTLSSKLKLYRVETFSQPNSSPLTAGVQHPRCVNSLAWSDLPEQKHLLLASFVRHNRDPSVLMFDVTRASEHRQHQRQSVGVPAVGTGCRAQLRPAGEYCKNEKVQSAVFSRQPSTLIAATDKLLKIIDMREEKQLSSISTRAVHSLCCDPHSTHRFCTCADTVVYVWDQRQTSIPVVTLQTPKRVLKLKWSPTRPGFLGCLCADSPTVRLYDLQYAGRDLMEASVSVRTAVDATPNKISFFTWHTSRYNSLLTLDNTGRHTEHCIKERVTLNWSCRGELIYSGDGSDCQEQLLRESASVSHLDSSGVATAITVQHCHDKKPNDDAMQPQPPSHGARQQPLSCDQSLETSRSSLAKSALPNPGRLYSLQSPNWLSIAERLETEKDKRGTAVRSKDNTALAKIIGNDISIVLCHRALEGYGLNSNDRVAENGEVLKETLRLDTGRRAADDEQAVRAVWQWLGISRSVTKAGMYRLRSGQAYNYHGVLSIVSQLSSHRSDTLLKTWTGLDARPGAPGNVPHTPVFWSEERCVCLQLLQWLPVGAISHSAALQKVLLDDAIVSAERSQDPCRAAALAVFQLNLPRAIAILKAAASDDENSNLFAVAMALAGYSGGSKVLWQDTCSGLRQRLDNAYLRAAFAFLTAEGESYDTLLLSKELSVGDRLAFAITFLSDTKLLEFVEQLKLALLNDADILCLLITGLDHNHGVNVVQGFVDRTSDVQTAALLALHGFRHTAPLSATAQPSLQSGDPRLVSWVDRYMELLSSFQLWWHRSHLLLLVPGIPEQRQRTMLACQYCHQSIGSLSFSSPAHKNPPPPPPPPAPSGGSNAPHSPPKSQPVRMTPPQQHNKLKVMSCPHCRQPLPRCSLCLLRLGSPSLSIAIHNQHHGHKGDKSVLQEGANTPHHLHIPNDAADRLVNNKPGVNSFSNWFTWCQTCRHGGHANHIIQWFSEHCSCPVIGCKCQCLLQDSFS